MYRRLGEASCQPTTAAGIRVCVHNRVGRVEVTSDDALDRWLVLRVGGPHPQISLFERTAPRSWRANFKLCRAGRYTIHVRAMMAQQPWLEWSANWTAHRQGRRAPARGMRAPYSRNTLLNTTARPAPLLALAACGAGPTRTSIAVLPGRCSSRSRPRRIRIAPRCRPSLARCALPSRRRVGPMGADAAANTATGQRRVLIDHLRRW